MIRYLVIATTLVALPPLWGADPASNEFFETRIRPVLALQCYPCHNSADTAEGELALDFRDGLRRGGSGGPLITPGDPAASRLIAILKHEIEGLEMPADNAKLADRVIADFETWISAGAVDPRQTPPSDEEILAATSWTATLQRRKRWWCFQPIQRPRLPAGKGHPIDKLIRAKLEQAGLSPAPPAEPTVLIRRLYLTLIGLPPTPQELADWTTRYAVTKTDPSTVTAELIDELLASDQFGPRWARHWMDWIRYAESHGSEGDPPIDQAWMYRDYLIRALNDDVPYDQLVREHLAGDLLASPRINRKLGLNESILGPIQLRMVFHGFSPTDALDEKVRFVDDQVNTLSKAFLGLTVSCARCHDHKFDAISQADYYALFGILAACRPARNVIDLEARVDRNREALAELKPQIRDAVAAHWIDSLTTLPERMERMLAGEFSKDSLLAWLQPWKQHADESALSAAWQAWVGTQSADAAQQEQLVRRWNFADPDDYTQWHSHGRGSVEKISDAGAFAVAPAGELALTGIYPAGVYSHLLSSKHAGRITSPDVQLDERYDFWVRAIGADAARTRYVIQDYPRTGTVYPAIPLTPSWTWHRLNLDYWRGDAAHFELATAQDIPLLVVDQPRSWFGVTEVRLVSHDSPPPLSPAPYATAIIHAATQPPRSIDDVTGIVLDAIDTATRAWQQGTCTDDQAELLDHCQRIGLLENRVEALTQAKPLIDRYRRLEAKVPVPRRVPGVEEVPSRQQPLFVRGDHKQPTGIVPRRFLEAIDADPYPAAESGRLQLAEDLLRDDNPLSRRVIVNRLWHHMFGSGIVATVDNFGRMGSQPTHPELLDYLADRFVRDGWSLKKMIRLMATSQTWQQSSRPDPAALKRDPDNTLLSHANLRRLEAEALRDAMLQASGQLDLTASGQPVDAHSNRRSVFLKVQRNSLNPMLRAFDFPEPFTAVGRRDVTNVPAQSLLMMNSPQVARYAAELAQRVVGDDSRASSGDPVGEMFQRLFARSPTTAERQTILTHVSETGKRLAERQQERARLKSAIASAQQQIRSIMEPKRQELSQSLGAVPQWLVSPIAEWEFDHDATDSRGELDGMVSDGAQVWDGQLVVNNGGHVNTSPLTHTLAAKTLEAWVRLDTLDQRGGGVMTVQTMDGRIFDSIVFAEKEPRRWLAGSDGFARTEPFAGGEEESEAQDRPVHVAICYHEDGTVVGYREGQRYGKPFQTTAPVRFEAGKAMVSFGVRHLPNVGNRRLAGRIERAHLYDRALTDEEIAESFHQGSGRVSDRQVRAALSATAQTRLAELESQIDLQQRRIEAIGPLPESNSADRGVTLAAWTDVAKSLLMLKEFMYVR